VFETTTVQVAAVHVSYDSLVASQSDYNVLNEMRAEQSIGKRDVFLKAVKFELALIL
jgi:hypothetical protein